MIGGIILEIVGLFIIIGSYKLFKPIDYSKWKEADGIVDYVRTTSWINGELRPSLPHLVVYFEIDGRTVKGTSNCIGTDKTIKQVIKKYPKGTQVHFWYNDNKTTIISKIAGQLNFDQAIYFVDDEFSVDNKSELKYKLFIYAFGAAFIVMGIIQMIQMIT